MDDSHTATLTTPLHCVLKLQSKWSFQHRNFPRNWEICLILQGSVKSSTQRYRIGNGNRIWNFTCDCFLIWYSVSSLFILFWNLCIWGQDGFVFLRLVPSRVSIMYQGLNNKPLNKWIIRTKKLIKYFLSYLDLKDSTGEWKIQHGDYGQWYCNSIAWWQMVATLVKNGA